MNARILGLGSYLPERVRTNADWPADFAGHGSGRYGDELTNVRAGDADPCDAITARHLAAEAGDPFRGATRRRVADPSTSSAEAEAIAARRALEDARVPAREIDLILGWAMVPDRITPPTAPRVAHLVGATRAAGIGLDVACATVVAQLTLGAALIESGRARLVLLTQSHLLTRASPLMHPASPLVGDAATAIVLGAAEGAGVLASHMVSHGEHHAAVTWARGRGDHEEPWWEAGPAYAPGTRDRERVAEISARLVHIGRDTIAELLERARRPIGSIDALACTQPRRWFPAAVAESVGLPLERAPHTFDELGHVGACAVVTNLIEARARGLLPPGATALLYGMGAGVTRAAALVSL